MGRNWHWLVNAVRALPSNLLLVPSVCILTGNQEKTFLHFIAKHVQFILLTFLFTIKNRSIMKLNHWISHWWVFYIEFLCYLWDLTYNTFLIIFLAFLWYNKCCIELRWFKKIKARIISYIFIWTKKFFPRICHTKMGGGRLNVRMKELWECILILLLFLTFELRTKLKKGKNSK